MRTSGAGTGAPHAAGARRLVPSGALGLRCAQPGAALTFHTTGRRSRPHLARARGPPERRVSGRRSPRSFHSSTRGATEAALFARCRAS